MIKRLLFLLILLHLASPLFFLSTGIGQIAPTLSAEPILQANGMLSSSPKALALHQLALPLRLQSLLVPPLLLLLFFLSGYATALRTYLERGPATQLTETRLGRLFDNLIQGLTRRRLGLSRLLEISLFLSVISLLLAAINLPRSLYVGYVLRHQFGLSTQTLPAWLRDFGLNVTLEWLGTLLIFGGLYLLWRLLPRRWPFWAGLGFAIFTLGYIVLEPLVITPLFNTLTPVSDPALQARIEMLAERAGVEIDAVYILDASRRTTQVNAYFTGFGERSKIYLWDTLLAGYPPAEVDVVIAHEMGHWVYQHVWWGSLGLIAAVWLGLFGGQWLWSKLWPRFGLRRADDLAGYPLLLAGLALVTLLSLPVQNGIVRAAENQADDFALEISQDPKAAITLFTGFTTLNLSRVDVPPWEQLLFHTHPSVGQRIEKAQRWQMAHQAEQGEQRSGMPPHQQEKDQQGQQ